jgi:hypothetical protein
MISENLRAIDAPPPPESSLSDTARDYIEVAVEKLIRSLTDPAKLSRDQRRGIIARYTAVLEGNFIYWMTATYLSARSPEAQDIIRDNLREEVRDNHPGMLRRFTLAARASSTDEDRVRIDKDLQAVRGFVVRMTPLQIIPMMAFFEGFIQRFMPYLAELAALQGSSEREYTDVHSVGDIAHTQGLLNAFSAELVLETQPVPRSSLVEGIEILRSLIERIIYP